MTAKDHAELAQLRALYDQDKPPAAVMRPIPDARLRRLIELERMDAAAEAHAKAIAEAKQNHATAHPRSPR